MVKFLPVREIIRGWTTAIIWVYFTILYGWLVVYLATGDRIAIVSAVNMLAVYLFYPLPLVIVAAIFRRNKAVWTGTVGAAAAFLWFWGGLFLPKLASNSPNPGAAQTLVVMTYNVLGVHDFTTPVIDTIQSENPDIVLLQELNPTLAEALRVDLAACRRGRQAVTNEW